MDIGAAFLTQSREYLTEHYLPKILAAVDQLSDEDLWWRPNAVSNSVGNLMLHLSGNVRQWIVSGLGGAPDDRVRQLEFDASERLYWLISRNEDQQTYAIEFRVRHAF